MNRICSNTIFLVLLILLCLTAMPLYAADDDLEELGIIESASESLVTTARTPRPASLVAENITVITAADIQRLNAHTLAEVLQTVPGI